jgi:hypothetical protein
MSIPLPDEALCQVSDVQGYLETPDVDTTLLTRLVLAASGEIEHYCQRRFLSQNYLYWMDGIGGRNDDLAPFLGFMQLPEDPHSRAMWLPNYPVTAVRRVTINLRDALTVSNSSTDAAYATVMADSDAGQLTLTVVGGANSGSSTLAYATCTTVGAMVSAINALGAGWIATAAVNSAAWPSTEIRPMMSAGCLNLNYTLQAPDLPVGDCDVDMDSGRLWRASGWPQGVRNVFVDYTGGYTTVPSEIVQTVIELCKRAYDMIENDENLKSESFAGYSWASRSALEKGADLQEKLALHRRIIL